jgi:hypothetical protein
MKPKQVDGKPIAGGTVRIPLRFIQNGTEPVAPIPSPTSPGALVLARDYVSALHMAATRRAQSEFSLRALEASTASTLSQDVRADGITALREATAETEAAMLEDRARIFASIYSESELKDHLDYARSSTAAVLTGMGDLQRVYAGISFGRVAQIRAEAREIYCAERDCKTEPDFVSGRAPDFEPGLDYQPDWLEKPGSDQVRNAFPVVARLFAIDGDAGLQCQTGIGGLLKDCRVAAEAPDDLGFGQAAMKLAGYYRLRPPPDGSPSPRSVWVTVHFHEPIWSSASVASPSTRPENALRVARQIAAIDAEDFLRSVQLSWAHIVWPEAWLEDVHWEDVPAAERRKVDKAFMTAINHQVPDMIEAGAAFYANLLTDDQLQTLLIYQRSSAANAAIRNADRIEKLLESASAHDDERIRTLARQKFCKSRDCEVDPPPR